MKVAIAQPAYLPWLGYFDLLDQVDQFVLLDSVQFEKQSWQQRNRIKTPRGLQWLTVPAMFRGRLHQRIRDVEIREAEFWRDHLRAVELNYKRSQFFDAYFPDFESLLKSKSSTHRLVELTSGCITWFAGILNIKTPIVFSSELPVQGGRTKLLAEICGYLGANAYLSPIGSAAYLLEEMEILTARGITVEFQHYEHPEYRQLFPPFQPYACILDLMMNEGERSLDIIRSGRQSPLLPEQVDAYLKRGANH
jgi:hypothetical protein